MKKKYFIAALIATMLFAITSLTSCKKCPKCVVETVYYEDGIEQFDQEESDKVKNCDGDLEEGTTITSGIKNGIVYNSKTKTTCELP